MAVSEYAQHKHLSVLTSPGLMIQQIMIIKKKQQQTNVKNSYEHSMQRDTRQGRKSNIIFPILQNLLFCFKQKVRRSVTIK